MNTEPSSVGILSEIMTRSPLSQSKNEVRGALHTTNNNKIRSRYMDHLPGNSVKNSIFRKGNTFRKSNYSQKAIRLLAFLGLLFFSISLFAQTTGDYRSRRDGDWDNPNTWQVFDGTDWVNATNYPGELTTSNSVTIRDDDEVDLDFSVPNAITTIVVGDGSGSDAKLIIEDTSSLDVSVLIINSDGEMEWDANVTLTLPASAAIVIQPGGDVDGSPCSAAKRIEIGATIIASCNGGAGALYDFDELVAAGGAAGSTDTDGDGIGDYTDLDDDNHGIPDEEEYCTDLNTALLASADVGERTVVVNHSNTGYLRLDFSSLDNSFQLDINGSTVHSAILEFDN